MYTQLIALAQRVFSHITANKSIIVLPFRRASNLLARDRGHLMSPLSKLKVCKLPIRPLLVILVRLPLDIRPYPWQHRVPWLALSLITSTHHTHINNSSSPNFNSMSRRLLPILSSRKFIPQSHIRSLIRRHLPLPPLIYLPSLREWSPKKWSRLSTDTHCTSNKPGRRAYHPMPCQFSDRWQPT